jgi:hypothetical protein
MVRSSGKGARLRVETIYPGLGVVRTHTVGGERPEWGPTHPLHLTADESVQIRLTPVSGDWQLDDLYVDPFARY